MVLIKNLSFFYNKNTPFIFPDLTCKASEVVLITGNSGTGKTTLLHLMAGLLRPINGDIIIDNEAITGFSEKQLDKFRGNKIGLILQNAYFISSLTVVENLVLASWLATGKQAYKKAQELLGELGLADYSTALPANLSVGQQQRVAIARALINEPKLILADEPTSSLDDENACKVADLLETIAKKHNASLVIVTHDSRLKNRFSNQINLN